MNSITKDENRHILLIEILVVRPNLLSDKYNN